MTPRNASFEKALSLLRFVATGTRDLPTLAALSGLPTATVHRYMKALVEAGFLYREKRGHYHVGLGLAELAAAFDLNMVLPVAGRPYLKALAKATGKTAHLAVLEDDMVTYLAKEAGRDAAVYTLENAQLEAYCSGLGKVLLAGLSPDARQKYISNGPFVALTAHTITEPGPLAQELDRIAQHGYAMDDCEVYDTLKCVAVPICNSRGDVLAAISISGAADDFTPDFIDLTRQRLQQAAQDIARKLGTNNGISQ